MEGLTFPLSWVSTLGCLTLSSSCFYFCNFTSKPTQGSPGHLLSIKLTPTLTMLLYPLWTGTSLVAQMVRNQPAMGETQVRSLGQEDPLEKEMATHSSILAWEIL